MFTRCPECETTFRLGANDLRRAQGKVRCGECNRVFNALEYLAEDEEVEAETGKEWPIEPANDSLADTIIDRPPQLGGGHEPATAPDERPDPGSDDSSADRWSAEPGGEPAEADDEFDYGEFLLDEIEEEPATDENSPAPGNNAGAGIGAADAPADDRAEPPLASIAADEDADAEDEDDDDPVLYIDGDSDEIDDEEKDDLSAEDEPVVFEPGEDQETAESDQIQPREDAGADLAREEDDFDDTIWERIPGVGSIASAPDAVSGPREDDRYITESERSYNHEGDWLSEDSDDSVSKEDAEDTLSEDEIATEPGTDDADDLAESMEFNAPKDKWSSIFASTASWRKEAEEEPVSFIADDDDWDDATVDDEVGDDDIEDDVAEEEEPAIEPGGGLFATRHLAAENDEDTDLWEDGLAEPDETDTEDEDVWEIAADDDIENGGDSAGWADNIEASLSTTRTVDEPITEDDADAPMPEPEEPPAEGYDVQHIVLQDESEEPAEKQQESAPSWRAEPYAAQPERASNTTRWLIASLTMIVLLGLQLVHYNRDSLATNAAWGPTIRDVYAGLGLELYPEWSIGDYEIRGSEAVAGESGPDVMDIRAQIAAVGRGPVGLPYLRVILRDRWSNPVAARHFSPAEYAQDESLPADLLMQPNSTINAHVSIADPGSGAQGFELELCLPRRHTGMDCSGKPFK